MKALLGLLRVGGGDTASGNETCFYGPEIKIEKNTISVLNVGCFIQLSNVVHVRKATVGSNRYGLILGLSSKEVFSLISDSAQVVAQAYDYVQKVMNTNSFDGAGHFSFGAGNPAIPMHDRTAVPAKRQSVDPRRLFVEEVARAVVEVNYSSELGDQQKQLLINILMDAKESVERNSHEDADRSRTRFKDFMTRMGAAKEKVLPMLIPLPNLARFFGLIT